MNKRVVILWVCFFVWAVSLMAQDVPGGVVAAFKKGNSQELNGYLSDKVELILEDRSINVDRRTAEGDRKSTRLNSSHQPQSRMPSSA